MSAHFFHFLCNRLIIRDTFCIFSIRRVNTRCVYYMLFYSLQSYNILGYNQKNSEKIAIFNIFPLPFPLSLRYH